MIQTIPSLSIPCHIRYIRIVGRAVYSAIGIDIEFIIQYTVRITGSETGER